MDGRYNEGRFKQNKEPIIIDKFAPFVLGNNPFPSGAGLGIDGFPIGKIAVGSNINRDIPFSEDLREKQIKELNEKLFEFIQARDTKLLWLCGNQGVGKTAFLQYFFDKPLLDETKFKKDTIKYWYITYDLQQEVSFLNNPSKYLLEHFIKNLYEEDPKDKVFLESITGAIFKFLMTENAFNTHKGYLKKHYSDEDFEDIKKGIMSEGKTYIEKLLNGFDDKGLCDFIKLLEVINNSRILDVENDYFNGFIKPFVQAKLDSSFLTENKVISFLKPKIKAKQEAVLVNTIKFLTSGAFDHYILIVDQIDVAWEKSKNAQKRKKDFFDGISSLIRRLNESGLILIFAVMKDTADELNEYIKENKEASRIASQKNIIEVPEINDREDVKKLIKEYLDKDAYRQKNRKLLDEKTEKHSTSEGLFPFDDSSCGEILSRSSHKTVQSILDTARQAIEYAADKLEENETSEKYDSINAALIEEMMD